MKNLLIVLTFLFSYQLSNAQVEVSTNPVALLFEIIPLSVSKPLSHDFSLGVDLLAVPNQDTFVYYAKGRYYFNPKMGADRFHVGAFLGGADDEFGLGFFAGHKIMSKRGVFLDLGLGIGRSFGGEPLPYGQFHLGYRFGEKRIEAKIK